MSDTGIPILNGKFLPIAVVVSVITMAIGGGVLWGRTQAVVEANTTTVQDMQMRLQEHRERLGHEGTSVAVNRLEKSLDSMERKIDRIWESVRSRP